MKLTDDVKQRKQKHFKQYHAAKQKVTNKENLVRFLHRGKPEFSLINGLCFIFGVTGYSRESVGFYSGGYVPVSSENS